MRKAVWSAVTILFMLILSLLLTGLVDGMVEIGDDTGVLLVFLGAVNVSAAFISVRLYKKWAASGNRQ